MNKRMNEWMNEVFNPLTAKLFNCNFHPLEVVSRWRDPQLQVSENSDLTKWKWNEMNRALGHLCAHIG